ncbi:MAG: DinB family protein [Rhodobacterales bacterium]
MINPAYVLTMARYNAWQNKQMKAAMEELSEDALRKERGAFFGSIMATANHILWADRMWMARLLGKTPPQEGMQQSTTLTPTYAVWSAERFRMDGRILLWAEKCTALDLVGELRWYSGVLGREASRPVGLVLTHMFNHQTHHRGQIHAMLTEAEAKAPVSDLIFMPEDGPWL